MKAQPEKFYLLLDDPELTNVCFWYVPERLRPRNFPQAYTSDWQRELGKVKTLKGKIILHFTVSKKFLIFSSLGNFLLYLLLNVDIQKLSSFGKEQLKCHYQ
jgi:hypothetical protein